MSEARRRNALRLALLTLVCTVFLVAPAAPIAAPGDLIQRVYTDKARYNPGDSATITVEIKNNTGATWNGTLFLDVRHLETIVHSASLSLNVTSGATTTKTFAWTTPSTDFRGYHVEVRAGTTDSNATAIDVSSSWTRYPRYGYVHAFPSGQTQSQSDDKIQQLSEDYHLNGIQFYDWMWRHDKVIKRTGGSIDDPWSGFVPQISRTLAKESDLRHATRVHETAPTRVVHSQTRDHKTGTQNCRLSPNTLAMQKGLWASSVPHQPVDVWRGIDRSQSSARRHSISGKHAATTGLPCRSRGRLQRERL